jgi:maleate cis-trans isomerase
LIVAGGSPLVTLQGYGSERHVAERLTQVCGVPCVTGIQLEVEALRAVGSQRPAIASPYPPALDERLVAYLGAAGFDVQGCVGLGIVDNAEIGALPEYASLHAGRRAAAAAPGADAVFLPCARWPTLDSVRLLEEELGLPVVSATLAVFYGAFERLAIRDEFSAFGSLLGSLRPKRIRPGPPRLDGVDEVAGRQAEQPEAGHHEATQRPQLLAHAREPTADQVGGAARGE